MKATNKLKGAFLAVASGLLAAGLIYVASSLSMPFRESPTAGVPLAAGKDVQGLTNYGDQRIAARVWNALHVPEYEAFLRSHPSSQAWIDLQEYRSEGNVLTVSFWRFDALVDVSEKPPILTDIKGNLPPSLQRKYLPIGLPLAPLPEDALPVLPGAVRFVPNPDDGGEMVEADVVMVTNPSVDVVQECVLEVAGLKLEEFRAEVPVNADPIHDAVVVVEDSDTPATDADPLLVC